MNNYSVAMFLHILSALALMSGVAMEIAYWRRFQTARSGADLKQALDEYMSLKWLGIPAFLGILVTGGYLGHLAGDRTTYWIPISFASVILMMLIGGFLTGRPMMRATQIVIKSDSSGLNEAKATLSGFSVRSSWRMRVCLMVGILGLMIFKPGLWTSGAIIVSAILGGLLMGGLSDLKAGGPHE